MVKSPQNKKLNLTIKKKIVKVDEILKFTRFLKILVSRLVGFYIFRENIETIRYCKKCKKFSIFSHQSEYIDKNISETLKVGNKFINVGICSNCCKNSKKKNK